MSETNKLEIVLGYQFKDLSLFSRALTHKSFAADDNERLEFLGDAVLGLMVSDLLYAHFPEYSEGQLSMIKSYMVSKKFLHRIANALNLESQIRFNRENPKKSQAVLANTVEALIGAIFLDSDYKTTLSIMAPFFTPYFDDIDPLSIKNPKNTLQEYTQQRAVELPVYDVVSVNGPPHAQTFEVNCRLTHLDWQTTASSSTKKEAEQLAAMAMLKKLKEELK